MDRVMFLFRIIRSILWTIWFNLRYLPFKQAIKLPIILYKPHLKNNSGKYIIEGKITFGMIRLGFPNVSIFPNSGITLENRGIITFKGKCKIGNDSAISLGERGILIIGKDFISSCGLRLVCYHRVIIEETVSIGWNTIIQDTDFHSLKSINGDKKPKGYGSIEIGHNVWVSSFCKLYKNTRIPNYCTVAANTILRKKIDCPEYSMIYNSCHIETRYIARYRDRSEDTIYYE